MSNMIYSNVKFLANLNETLDSITYDPVFWPYIYSVKNKNLKNSNKHKNNTLEREKHESNEIMYLAEDSEELRIKERKKPPWKFQLQSSKSIDPDASLERDSNEKEFQQNDVEETKESNSNSLEASNAPAIKVKLHVRELDTRRNFNQDDAVKNTSKPSNESHPKQSQFLQESNYNNRRFGVKKYNLTHDKILEDNLSAEAYFRVDKIHPQRVNDLHGKISRERGSLSYSHSKKKSGKEVITQKLRHNQSENGTHGVANYHRTKNHLKENPSDKDNYKRNKQTKKRNAKRIQEKNANNHNREENQQSKWMASSTEIGDDVYHQTTDINSTKHNMTYNTNTLAKVQRQKSTMLPAIMKVERFADQDSNEHDNKKNNFKSTTKDIPRKTQQTKRSIQSEHKSKTKEKKKKHKSAIMGKHHILNSTHNYQTTTKNSDLKMSTLQSTEDHSILDKDLFHNKDLKPNRLQNKSKQAHSKLIQRNKNVKLTTKKKRGREHDKKTKNIHDPEGHTQSNKERNYNKKIETESDSDSEKHHVHNILRNKINGKQKHNKNVVTVVGYDKDYDYNTEKVTRGYINIDRHTDKSQGSSNSYEEIYSGSSDENKMLETDKGGKNISRTLHAEKFKFPEKSSLRGKAIAQAETLTPHNIRNQLHCLKKMLGKKVLMEEEVIGRTVEYNDIVLWKIKEKKKRRFSFRVNKKIYADDSQEKNIVFIVHGLTVMGWHDLDCLSNVERFKTLLTYYLSNLNSFDIYLIPMANPDGVTKATFAGWWNKNVSPQKACPGVNLDRNFDVAWNDTIVQTMSSCGQLYPGPRPFSEHESRAVKDVFHRYGQKMVAYMHVHAGTYDASVFKGDAVLYPKGYTDISTDDDKYVDLKGEIDEAMRNTSFKVLSVTVDTLYNWYGKTTGSSVDYAASIYGIPYALELVMQVYEDNKQVFDKDKREKNTALTEIWQRLIDVIFNQIYEGAVKPNERK